MNAFLWWSAVRFLNILYQNEQCRIIINEPVSDTPVVTKSTFCSAAGFYRCRFCCCSGRYTIWTVLVLSILSTMAYPSALIPITTNSLSCRCFGGGSCGCLSCGGCSSCSGCCADCNCCGNSLMI